MVTLLLSLALLVPASEPNTGGFVLVQDDKEKEEPTLKFSRDGKARYEEGKKLYEEKKYREAHDAFKAARKSATGRTTKRVISQWSAACEGALLLQKNFLPQYDAGQYKKTWAQIEQRYGMYEGTPIQKEYDDLRTKLRDKLFHVLDDFDRPSGRFTKKHGKEFISDPEFVKQGARALKWETVDKPSELKIKKVPRNMAGYEAISYWIYFPKGKMDYTLNFMGAGKSATDTGQLTANGFQMNMKPPKKKGWSRVEVPLKKFSQFGKVEWENIKDFRIRFKANKRITCYLDDVSLVKK